MICFSFFVFLSRSLSKQWLTSVHNFLPRHKNGHFFKTRFLQKNSGFRPFKTLFVAGNAFWGFQNLQLPLEQKSFTHTHTTFIAGELILQLHTHQLHSFNSRGINLCSACVSLVSACFASMIFQKGNYTTIMLGELISNYMHTSYTSIIVGELIV